MHVLLVGDLHDNPHWLSRIVLPAADKLAVDAIVQLGDFGYWPNAAVPGIAAESPVPFYFLDGNHEHHPQLIEDVKVAKGSTGASEFDPVRLDRSLWYLPRGSRWTWDGVRLGALGGAHSIDRQLRKPGVSWFPQEAITSEDLARHADAGPCQVLFTHDAPLSARVPTMPRSAMSGSWRAELPACDAHRALLDEAVDSARCRYLVHGHFHVRYDSIMRRPWGDVIVVSLAEDASDLIGNMALLTCHDGVAEVQALSVD